jgi:hypothetical protein
MNIAETNLQRSKGFHYTLVRYLLTQWLGVFLCTVALLAFSISSLAGVSWAQPVTSAEGLQDGKATNALTHSTTVRRSTSGRAAQGLPGRCSTPSDFDHRSLSDWLASMNRYDSFRLNHQNLLIAGNISPISNVIVIAGV